MYWLWEIHFAASSTIEERKKYNDSEKEKRANSPSSQA